MKKLAILMLALLPGPLFAGQSLDEQLDELNKVINTCLHEKFIEGGEKNPQLCREVGEKQAALVAKIEHLPGVAIGMSKNQVLNKTHWGRPESINVTTSQYGTREQWVYGNGNYLYFEGRDPAKLKLTHVQTSN
jgi:hypothetical protein